MHVRPPLFSLHTAPSCATHHAILHALLRVQVLPGVQSVHAALPAGHVSMIHPFTDLCKTACSERVGPPAADGIMRDIKHPLHVDVRLCAGSWVLTVTLQLVGDPTILISNDQPWEGQVVEAPFMWQQDGRYYLFYSGNGYDTPHYGVGYAVADRPEGKHSHTLCSAHIQIDDTCTQTSTFMSMHENRHMHYP